MTEPAPSLTRANAVRVFGMRGLGLPLLLTEDVNFFLNPVWLPRSDQAESRQGRRSLQPIEPPGRASSDGDQPLKLNCQSVPGYNALCFELLTPRVALSAPWAAGLSAGIQLTFKLGETYMVDRIRIKTAVNTFASRLCSLLSVFPFRIEGCNSEDCDAAIGKGRALRSGYNGRQVD